MATATSDFFLPYSTPRWLSQLRNCKWPLKVVIANDHLQEEDKEWFFMLVLKWKNQNEWFRVTDVWASPPLVWGPSRSTRGGCGYLACGGIKWWASRCPDEKFWTIPKLSFSYFSLRIGPLSCSIILQAEKCPNSLTIYLWFQKTRLINATRQVRTLKVDYIWSSPCYA